MEPDVPQAAAPTATRSRRRVLLALALVALVVRAALVLGGADVRRGPRDLEDRYDKIAHSLLRGHGFARGGTPTATAPPLYPLFLAGVYGTLGESKTGLMLVLALLDAVTCALCAAVAWRLLGREVGILAGLAVAFSPYSVYSVLLAGTDTLSVFLNWVGFFFLVGAVDTRRGWRFLAAGGALGAAALCRASALLLPVFLLPLALVARELPWRRRALHAAALLLGAAVLITPWTARNWVRFGQFIPIQTLGGMHVLQGAPLPPGLNPLAPAVPPGAAAPVARSGEKFNPANAARDADYYGTAWQRIKARPLAYLRNIILHAISMWFRTQSSDFRWFLWPVNCALLALTAIGVFIKRRELWRLAPLWFPIVYYIGVHTITYPVLRYILPIIPAMTTLAAVPLVWLLLRSRRPAPVAP